MEYKYFLIKVFINTFDQFNVPLVNKSINLFQQKRKEKTRKKEKDTNGSLTVIFKPICAIDNHD